MEILIWSSCFLFMQDPFFGEFFMYALLNNLFSLQNAGVEPSKAPRKAQLYVEYLLSEYMSVLWIC